MSVHADELSELSTSDIHHIKHASRHFAEVERDMEDYIDTHGGALPEEKLELSAGMGVVG